MPQSPDQDAKTRSPSSTSDQEAMNLGDDDLLLHCVIEGETEVFQIDVEGSLWHNPKFMVGTLKGRIQEERKDGSLSGVDRHSLELWKVRAIEESRCLEIWLTRRLFSPKTPTLSM